MVSSPKVTDAPSDLAKPKPTRQDPPCPLAELVQYDCRISVQRLPEGNVEECIVCEEVPRIFRLCPGRPSVEVTRTVKFDSQGRAYEPRRPLA
ncbi:hypothetical protein BCV69DRAFT_140625 [Microstroma glucosiphilum]|uniref:Uncharacterized protein n=1 Tax=Pseudomicrostroma glucosiphilum TaxID=1684307 RepID=A0A316UAY6_9BASI|nr:hypothetical protein BCV69DRAFT_140625 [Pseudomicrostroma glucosiphilum]PWN22319.1 hypothetical protein BCV69DRAFT_140625 [Pseudomicrostroma glucosiphilum]